ncbi:hypothetical protein VPH35_089844 [Triticum aestivum]
MRGGNGLSRSRERDPPLCPSFRVAKFSPIVDDRALQLPPCRTSASPPTPQSRLSPLARAAATAVPVLPRRDVVFPLSPPRPRGDWVLSLGTGIFFEVIEAILIDKLNSVDYTENQYSAQLYFHQNTAIL